MGPMDYQRFVAEGSFYAGAGERNEKELVYLTLGLAGEAGEFADEVKKVVRSSFKISEFYQNYGESHEKLKDELGDVLWYLTGICNYLGISLEELAQLNTTKLCERHDIKWPPLIPTQGNSGSNDASR